MQHQKDIEYIRRALKLAHAAAEIGEVPIGSVIVKDDYIIAEGANRSITDHDPTAHAEIIALRNAGKQFSNYRLPDLTLYVTLEPCIMCMGAIIHARIRRLVFGAYDPKTGAAVSCYTIGSDDILNHQLDITGGICETECSELLKDFFRNKRKKN
jgi:tRNA(adenine34) deaminase